MPTSRNGAMGSLRDFRKDTRGQGESEGKDPVLPRPTLKRKLTVCVEGESRYESKYPSGRPLQSNPGVGCI